MACKLEVCSPEGEGWFDSKDSEAAKNNFTILNRGCRLGAKPGQRKVMPCRSGGHTLRLLLACWREVMPTILWSSKTTSPFQAEDEHEASRAGGRYIMATHASGVRPKNYNLALFEHLGLPWRAMRLEMTAD